MRDPKQYSSVKHIGITTLCALSLSILGVFAADKKEEPLNEPVKQEKTSSGTPSFLKMPQTQKSSKIPSFLQIPKDKLHPEPEPEPDTDTSAQPAEDESEFGAAGDNSLLSSPDSESDSEDLSSSSSTVLQGKTEHTHVVLEDQKLYKVAMKAIKNKEYAEGIRFLQMLTPQFDKGAEPLKAECKYYEAGCHKNLRRMKAAMDTYHEAYELFAKYDSSNPLKGKAWKEYELLRAMNGRMDTERLQASVQSNRLHARANNRQIAFLPQKGQFAIDPNVTLKAKANNSDVILRCNDNAILPKIVKNCFSKMSCLETAEIGSNVTNAAGRWVPLKVSGRTAAFAISGFANPAFRAKVNGRSYLFDINLPGLQSGLRKILVVTNMEKICAVDVDTYDTWLLRMKKTKSGRIIGARWYKLHHKKINPKTTPTMINPPKRFRKPKRGW